MTAKASQHFNVGLDWTVCLLKVGIIYLKLYDHCNDGQQFYKVVSHICIFSSPVKLRSGLIVCHRLWHLSVHQHFQTSPLKPLGQISYEDSLGWGNESLFNIIKMVSSKYSHFERNLECSSNLSLHDTSNDLDIFFLTLS